VALFSTTPRASTAKLRKRLCEVPAALGWAMFTTGTPLPVLVRLGRWLAGAAGEQIDAAGRVHERSS